MALPDPLISFLIDYGLPLLIIVAILALTFLGARRRERTLAGVAGVLGFAFRPGDRDVAAAEFTRFPLFRGGRPALTIIGLLTARRKGIKYLMKGVREGQEVWLFDYEYASEDTRDLHTVAAFPLREDVIPKFTLAPEGMWQRIVGGPDIDFTSHLDFSNRFLLRGPDEEAVRALFQPRVLDALTKLQGRLNVQGGGKWMIVFGPRVKPEPERIRAFLDQALRVVQAFGKR